tara:strand:+ start:131 stop:277 length:147 start_codon:yes stop_codon:yes gene_type:complete
MLDELLIRSDENIDYQKYWKKTLAYRFFRIKEPSEGWKLQLRRILDKK